MKNHLFLRKRPDVLAHGNCEAKASPATPSAAYEMISMDEAQNIVLANIEVLPLVTVELQDALGLVLGNMQWPRTTSLRSQLPLTPGMLNFSSGWLGNFHRFTHSPSRQSRSADINLVASSFNLVSVSRWRYIPGIVLFDLRHCRWIWSQ